jgi:hypothetical protein
MMDDKGINICLTRAEALVLFEWLAREDKSDALRFEDASEEKVVWAIQAQLERTLAEPLQDNYKALLADARRTVRGKE